jgi:hypothetical protein
MLLFLGAGASCPFGIPTMSGFLKLFDEEIGDSSLYREIRKTFGDECDLEVVMTVIEDLSKPSQEFFRALSPQTGFFLLHIERKEADKYATEETKKREAMELLARLKAIIRRECIKASGRDSRIVEVYNDFFTFLQLEERKMTSGHWGSTQIGRLDEVFPTGLKVFTTNYDTCLEVYFNRREIDFCRGIVNRSGEDILDVDSYEPPRTPDVRIYKLHGSVDLFQKGGKIRQFKAPGTGKTFLGDEYGEESMRWPIEFGGYRHVIESPYLDLFRLLRDAAKADRWWIIIGFSFRDRTICSILNDVLGMKTQRDRPNALLLCAQTEPIVKRLRDWDYHALADTVYPVEVEFGNKDLSAKLHEAFVSRGYVKEMPVNVGVGKHP